MSTTMTTAADIIPSSVKDSLFSATSAIRRSASEILNALNNKILQSDHHASAGALLTTACDGARNDIEAAVDAHLSSLWSCFSSEFVKMAEEYELYMEEVKRQHEVKISLMRAENNVLKLSLEGKTRTLNIMKAIEKRSQIGEKSWEEYQREQAKIVSILKEEKLAQKTAASLAEEMKFDIGNLRSKVNNRAKKFRAMITRCSQNSSLPASASPGTEAKTEAPSQAKLVNKKEVDGREKVVIKVGKEVQKLGIFLKTVETYYKTGDGNISQKEVVVNDIRNSCVFHGMIGVGDKLLSINGVKVKSIEDVGNFANQLRVFEFEIADKNRTSVPSHRTPCLGMDSQKNGLDGSSLTSKRHAIQVYKVVPDRNNTKRNRTCGTKDSC